jgi:hypothetical protein
MYIFEPMNKTLKYNDSERINPNPEFVFVTVSDIAKRIVKLYSGTKKTDKKTFPKLVASFIHLITYLKDWESEYDNKYLAACCGLKYNNQVTYYRKKHSQYWESERYRIRIELALEYLKKIESSKKERFKNKQNIEI